MSGASKYGKGDKDRTSDRKAYEDSEYWVRLARRKKKAKDVSEKKNSIMDDMEEK